MSILLMSDDGRWIGGYQGLGCCFQTSYIHKDKVLPSGNYTVIIDVVWND